jgi:choline-sulfatase
VVARLDDGKLWKYSRYFDNPQYWSSPATPKDVIQGQIGPNPKPEDPQPAIVPFEVTVKTVPAPEEFEMYNVTDDPMELTNLYSITDPLPQQAVLAELLDEQRTQKRVTPCSGAVPGQEWCNPWGECPGACSE